jgi:hypothetical protein
MIVPGLSRDLALDQPARCLEIEHENLRLQQRRCDMLPLAGLLALEQRHHDTHGAEQAGAEIGDRDADAHRPLSRQAGHRHQATHALRDLIEPRAARIGPVLTEPRNAPEDDLRVHLLEVLIVDLQPLLHVRPEVLDHHVGLLDHALEGREPLRRLQVQRDGALVAMEVLEVRTLARAARRLARRERGRLLDLDHIGAPVRELTHAGGP